jgi:FkbM family methyltransferase
MADNEALLADRLVCDGEYGVFEGSAADRVVMAEYRALGSWAKDMVDLVVERLFGDGPGTFIDIGANIGLVVVPIVERTGSIGIAFEPEPKNFELLTRNVQRHRLDARIETLPFACYSEAIRLPLSLSPDNLGDHRLERTASLPLTAATVAAGERATVEVETRRLDDVLRGRELAHPIVLKLDTQGTEVRVLEGARETLARADYLISEYCPQGIVAHGDTAARFAELACGFPFGAVLHVLALPEPLHSSQHVFDQLGWIANDGSDPGFFDLLFARHWVLPNSAPELAGLDRIWRESPDYPRFGVQR